MPWLSIMQLELGVGFWSKVRVGTEQETNKVETGSSYPAAGEHELSSAVGIGLIVRTLKLRVSIPSLSLCIFPTFLIKIEDKS